MRQYPFSFVESGDLVKFTYDGGTHGDMTRICYVYDVHVGEFICYDFVVGGNRTFKLNKISNLVKLGVDTYTKIRYNTEDEKNDYQIAFTKHGGRCAIDYENKLVIVLLPEKFSVNGELVMHENNKHIIIQDRIVIKNGQTYNYTTFEQFKQIIATL